MQTLPLVPSAPKPSESRQAALLTLLADEDVSIYRTVRNTILSCGFSAGEWLHPHTLSNDPVLRGRAREILRHFARQRADVQFLGFCLQHGEEFDLEQAAWLLAATAYPEISIEGYRALLDHFAAELRARIDFNGPASQVLAAVNGYFFDNLKFQRGKTSELQVENCYLNRVVDRRHGDPVNACLLYLLLARRLRLPLAGISLPDYFICRYQSSSNEVYIDVFNRGRLLTKADCIQYLVRGSQRLPAEAMAPVSARRILIRSCETLHLGYLQLGGGEEAVRVQRYLVALRG